MLVVCVVGRLDDDYSLCRWEIESDFEMLMCWRHWRGMDIDLTFGDREMHDEHINMTTDVQMQDRCRCPEMF